MRARQHLNIFSPTKLWLIIFGIWAALLSGLLSGIVGSPGVLQAVQLNSFLNQKQEQVAFLESEIVRLDSDSERLEKSRVAQEREIRRVLGYAGEDELIFDFAE